MNVLHISCVCGCGTRLETASEKACQKAPPASSDWPLPEGVPAVFKGFQETPSEKACQKAPPARVNFVRVNN